MLPARPTLALVWAQARGGVIGSGGLLPWHLAEDLVRFRKLTAGHPVLMGRRTWDSLPPRFRPLPDRRNLVLTRNAAWQATGAEPVTSVVAAQDLVAASHERLLWVIGGGELYCCTIALASALAVTEVDLDVTGDTVAPVISDDWHAEASQWRTSTTGIRYRFVHYRRDGAETTR